MAGQPSTLMLLLRLALSLGLILGLVGGVTWILRRRGFLSTASGKGANGRLEILDRRSVGKRASLVVARVGGVSVLLGVTDQQISILSEADEIDAAWREDLASMAAVDSPPDEVGRGEGKARSKAAPRPASLVVGSRRTGTPVSASAVVTDSTGMSFVEALRELTVRRS